MCICLSAAAALLLPMGGVEEREEEEEEEEEEGYWKKAGVCLYFRVCRQDTNARAYTWIHRGRRKEELGCRARFVWMTGHSYGWLQWVAARMRMGWLDACLR